MDLDFSSFLIVSLWKKTLIKCATIEIKTKFIDLTEVEQKQTINQCVTHCSLLGFM